MAQLRAGCTKLAQIFSLGVENDDALVARVGYENAPKRIHGNATWTIELVIAFSRTGAPHLQEFPIGCKLLNAIVPGIGHIDTAIQRDGHSPRLVECSTRRGSFGDVCKGTPHLQNLPRGIEVLDAVIARVSHIQAAIRGQGDAARRLELAGSRTDTTHRIIRCDRCGNLSVWIDRYGNSLGDGAIRPELGNNILANIEGHLFGSAPICKGIGGVAGQGSPGGVIPVEPDLPDRVANFGIGEKWPDMRPDIFQVTDYIHRAYFGAGGTIGSQRRRAFRSDGIPLQAPVIHGRPPQAHVIGLEVILPHDRGKFGCVFGSGFNHQGVLQRFAGGVLIKIDLIGVIAHVPPVWIADIVIIRHHHIRSTGGAQGELFDLVH